MTRRRATRERIRENRARREFTPEKQRAWANAMASARTFVTIAEDVTPAEDARIREYIESRCGL